MKTLRTVTVLLLLFVALNALVGGYFFIKDPSGAMLHIPLTWLQHSPFTDFLFPGIILFIINGLMNVLAAFFVLLKWKNYSKLVLFQGVILICWIGAQVVMLQQIYFLHYLFAGIGILLALLGTQINAKGENNSRPVTVNKYQK